MELALIRAGKPETYAIQEVLRSACKVLMTNLTPISEGAGLANGVATVYPKKKFNSANRMCAYVENQIYDKTRSFVVYLAQGQDFHAHFITSADNGIIKAFPCGGDDMGDVRAINDDIDFTIAQKKDEDGIELVEYTTA